MFRSAYRTLTLLYVAVVMLISIIFSGAFYRVASNEINRGLGRQTRFIQDMPITGGFVFHVQDLEDNRIAQLQDSSQRLRDNLILFNLLILAAASAVSYAFAKHTLKPIEEMVEAQNRFTADASHELRTPLTALRTEIEVNLRDKKLSLAQSKKLLQSNLEEIDRLESLSSALLKLARYREATKREFTSVVLSNVITEAYEKIESLRGR